MVTQDEYDLDTSHLAGPPVAPPPRNEQSGITHAQIYAFGQNTSRSAPDFTVNNRDNSSEGELASSG